MTKRVQWLPNERVDIPDMDGGTNLLSVGLMQQWVDRMVLDHFPRVAAGFRVQIANQGTAPGQLSVFNGVAFDREGQILQNEDEENTSRSVTLLANGTYYIEATFVATPSDTDARAFWDPTVDNGTDPSGDPRLPGQETSQNVSTRLSPDWTIVTPVSTTNFEILTNPNSLKIPVAIITVAGGVITGASTSPPVSILESDISAGATSIKCLDTVIFPDGFTANLGAEAITVTANDRTNGVLTLAAGLVGGHSAGERLTQTGVSLNQFLIDRAAPALPVAGTADARPHLWQGDPNRGRALMQDPFTASGRGNPLVRALKDKIDELAAQVRELKFGAERDADIGVLGPPTTFPASPREYDLSGGVTGARTNTCSIGDGVTTWGDFNVSHYADAPTCFAAAIAYLGTSGGKIYVKRGVYNFPTTTTLPSSALNDSPVIFEGEGVECTRLSVTGTTPIFGGANFHGIFKNLNFTCVAGAPGCIGVTSTPKLAVIQMENCRIEGLYAVDHSAIQGYFRNVVFRVTSTANPYPLKGDFQSATFENCEFDGSQVNVAGTRSVLIGSPVGPSMGTFDLHFSDCLFEGPSNATAVVEFKSVGGASRVSFERCHLTSAASAIVPGILAGSATTVAINDLWIRDCESDTTGGLADLDNVIHAHISGCEISSLLDGGSNGIRLNTFGSQDVHIERCRFFQGGNSVTSSIGVDAQNVIGLTIEGCEFGQNDVAIRINNVSECTIRDNHHNNSGGTGRFFVLGVAAGSLVDASIVDNHVQDLNDPTSGLIYGVRLDSMVVNNVEISGNIFNSIGGATIAASVSGISVNGSGNNQLDRVYVCDNVIYNMDCTAAFAAVPILVSVPNGFAGFRATVCRNEIYTVGATSVGTIGIGFGNMADVECNENRLITIGNGTHTTVGISIGSCSSVICMANLIRTVASSGSGSGIQVGTSGNQIQIYDNEVDVQNSAIMAINVTQQSTATVPFIGIHVCGNLIGSADTGTVNTGISVTYKGSGGVLSKRIRIDDNSVRGFVQGIQVVPATPGTDVVSDVSISGNTLQSTNSVASGILANTVKALKCNNNMIFLEDLTANAKTGVYMHSINSGLVASNEIYIGNIDGTFAFIHIDNVGGSSDQLHIASNNMSCGSAAAAQNGVRNSGGNPADVTCAANVTRNIFTPYNSVHTIGDTGINQNA